MLNEDGDAAGEGVSQDDDKSDDEKEDVAATPSYVDGRVNTVGYKMPSRILRLSKDFNRPVLKKQAAERWSAGQVDNKVRIAK